MRGQDGDGNLIDWTMPVVGFGFAAALCFSIGFLVANDIPVAPVPTVASEAMRYDQAMKTRVNAGTAFAPFPNPTSSKCYHSVDHDSSDLCAQWRAALAAEESARWTRNSFWISLAGVILSAVGLVFVLLSLRQTRSALQAARDANQIARDSAETDIRPIIVFDGVELSEGAGTNNIYVVPRWRNIGKFPAWPITNSARRIYLDHVPRADDLGKLAADAPHPAADKTIIPADGTRLGGVKIVSSFDVKRHDKHEGAPHNIITFMAQRAMDRFQSETKVFMSFTIRYRSAIGPKTEWETEQLICVLPKWDGEGRMRFDDILFLRIDHLEEHRMT